MINSARSSGNRVNKLFLNLCQTDFIDEYINSETFPNLKDIYIKCEQYDLLLLRCNYGSSDIHTPIDYAHINCIKPLNWLNGFSKDDITIINNYKYNKYLNMHEPIEPIIKAI